MAEIIAQQIPAMSWLMPPPWKLWSGQDARMGIFEAAALAWTYFYTDDGRALQNRDLSMVQSRIQPGVTPAYLATRSGDSSPGPGIRPANDNGQAR